MQNTIISLPHTDFDVFVKKMLPHSLLAAVARGAGSPPTPDRACGYARV